MSSNYILLFVTFLAKYNYDAIMMMITKIGNGNNKQQTSNIKLQLISGCNYSVKHRKQSCNGNSDHGIDIESSGIQLAVGWQCNSIMVVPLKMVTSALLCFIIINSIQEVHQNGLLCRMALTM